MVCGSNTDQRDHFPRIHLDVLGIHQICIPTFPFDPPMQSDTCLLKYYFRIETSIIGCALPSGHVYIISLISRKQYTISMNPMIVLHS